MQIGKSDRAKQQHGEPVEYGFHGTALGKSSLIGKLAMLALFSWPLASCEAPPPTGQVIARVAEHDVTEREIDQELRSAGVAIEYAGPVVRNAAAERVVQRKIMAVEASKRGLDREGEFHFALRHARDELLAQALRRDLRTQSASPTSEEIAFELSSRPWAYRQRVRVALAALPGSNAPQIVQIDTGEAEDSLGRALLSLVRGDRIRIDRQEWVVISVTPLRLSETALVRFARSALIERIVDARLDGLVKDYRQSGRVHYQIGSGGSVPSADVSKRP